MWVGAHLGGLDRISLAGKTNRTYRHNPANPKSLPSDIVRDIKPYGRHLIVATQEGVAMMDPEPTRLRLYLHQKATQCARPLHRQTRPFVGSH